MKISEFLIGLALLIGISTSIGIFIADMDAIYETPQDFQAGELQFIDNKLQNVTKIAEQLKNKTNPGVGENEQDKLGFFAGAAIESLSLTKSSLIIYTDMISTIGQKLDFIPNYWIVIFTMVIIILFIFAILSFMGKFEI